jgi:hypothetical protein
MKKLLRFNSALVLLLLSIGHAQSQSAGVLRFAFRSTSADTFLNNPPSWVEAWMDQHFWRLQTYSPFFDSSLGWFPNAWAYLDLYGIPTNSPLVSQHPDWILHDSKGNKLYIPFACSNGSCVEYAGDAGNASFRNWWINNATSIMSHGYKGLWLDNVNMAWRVSDGNGNFVDPVDPRTGTAMTLSAWESYMSGMTSTIRSYFSQAEIIHNVIWFAGGAQGQTDSYMQTELQSANYIYLERGVSDTGLTGGSGDWSLNAFLKYIDKIHSFGRNVILGEYHYSNDYGTVGYYLISNGSDAFGNEDVRPNNWSVSYDQNLGAATGARYTWNGILRRDFANGIVLLSPPGSPSAWYTLPKTYRDVWGNGHTGVNLAGGQAIILLN